MHRKFYYFLAALIILLVAVGVFLFIDKDANSRNKGISVKQEEVRSSLLGFGPYPVVSDDMLDMFFVDTVDDLWNLVESQIRKDKDTGLTWELMVRVRIKLWNQGVVTRGVHLKGEGDTFRMYPYIENMAYVEWASKIEPNGNSSRYAVRKEGPGIEEVSHYFDRGEVPPGWTVKSFEDGAIDPYKFLNLKRSKL